MSFGSFSAKWARGGLAILAFVLIFAVSAVATTWIHLALVVRGRAVAVPDLYGMTLEEAQQHCLELGLVLVSDAAGLHSSVVAKDRILFQSPQPGSQIKAGRRLEATLSLGPELRRVPKLVGESLNFSQMLIRQAESNAGMIARFPSSLAAKGRVLAQSPPAGSEPGLDNAVSLLVSEGSPAPYYLTPDFEGKSYPLVKKFLDGHGFRTVVKIRGGDPSQLPRVMRQFPQAGYPIQKTHPITLEINRE